MTASGDATASMALLRAAQLHLFLEQPAIDVVRDADRPDRHRQPGSEHPVEPLEVEPDRLTTPTTDPEKVVRRDPPDPRSQRRVAAERAEVRHDPDEDLLGRVLGVLRVAEHPHGEPVDVVLEGSEQGVEGARIASNRLSREVLQRRCRLVGHPTAAGSGMKPSCARIRYVSSFTQPSTIRPSRTR